MVAVWKHAPCEGTDLLLLLALADNANDEGICWPSISTLSQKIRRCHRQTYDHLRRLEEAGAIHRHARRGKPTIYRVVTPAENRSTAATRSSTPAATRSSTPADHRHHNRNLEPTVKPPLPRAQRDDASPPLAPLWEVAIAEMHTQPETEVEREMWKGALRAIHQAGGTPDDLRTAFATYRRNWPTAQLSLPAIARYWSTLRRGISRERIELEDAQKRTSNQQRRVAEREATREELRQSEEYQRLLAEALHTPGS